ncbi:MAG: chlorite dismutase family protein [Acidimicrobiales bacterium]|jgi:chlorite dismutase|nr:chlorite dismutase family protein [Acidimicrobiales bacterium]MDP6649162.1 chlorite dismutase family protein [Acidimicrobiales bacterium]|tara:strand:- start:6406 stop:7095 length:690 start_codon:yes stop_codon:yes gene_type:complete
MSEPATPAEGLGVLHLFCRVGPLADSDAVQAVVGAAETTGEQVVPVAVLGHKADLAFMVLGDDLWRLRGLQTGLTEAGLEVVDSYVSLTEVSEYAADIPDEMKEARLRPVLPPEGKPAWCFYPMSKRRGEQSNWFTLSFEERHDLMVEHGASGRKFAGRILQIVTASTGVDDYEWGVTLFGQRPDDIKDVVYTLRYDEASAVYAEFGPFYTGVVGSLDEVLDSVGCRAG